MIFTYLLDKLLFLNEFKNKQNRLGKDWSGCAATWNG
jgi:hypothetical protein